MLPVSIVVVLDESCHLLMRLDAHAGGLFPSLHIGMGLFGISCFVSLDPSLSSR